MVVERQMDRPAMQAVHIKPQHSREKSLLIRGREERKGNPLQALNGHPLGHPYLPESHPGSRVPPTCAFDRPGEWGREPTRETCPCVHTTQSPGQWNSCSHPPKRGWTGSSLSAPSGDTGRQPRTQAAPVYETQYCKSNKNMYGTR